MRKLLTGLCLLFTLFSNAQVVINEVYGGGGNLNATYTHDYIELYNNSSSPVTMTDWSLQYASATGTAWGATAATKVTFSGTIPANGYFLIQLASGGSAGIALPTADATGTLNMGASTGKIALCNNNTTIVAAANPTDAQIIDKVGWGSTATGFETAPAPAPSASTTISRSPIGFDSGNNSTDFVAGAGSPNNTVTGNTISISVAAGNNASEAPANGNFTITFSSATTATTQFNFAYTGTAGFGTDYTVSYNTGVPDNPNNASGVLTVGAGTSSITVTITPVDDGDVEGPESIILTLSNPAAGYAIGTGNATINIIDNDAPPTVSVAPANSLTEPATNGGFTINLSNAAPAGGVTVTYTLTGTATQNSDYTDPQSGTVTVPAGANTVAVAMNVLNDNDGESPETIILTINTVSSPYVIGTGSASINVNSEDFTNISLTGIYSQNFNTLSNTGTTNLLAITGWLLNETGNGARDNEQYAADNGGSNTGDTYSYGATSTTERALGALQSGTLISTFGSFYTNNTGNTITKLRVTYTGEQWRLGATGRNDRLDFQYSTDATDLTTGTWINVDALDFVAPNSTGTVGAFDGNLAANRTTIVFDITGLSIPNGASFSIRWNDANASGADDGLAIDDFSIEANPLDLTPPVVISLAPSNGASNVPMNLSATIVFDEPVQKVGGNIYVKKTLDNSLVQTIAVNSSAVVVNSTSVSFPIAGLSSNTAYYIEVDNAAFEDQSGNDFAGISGSSTWAFTTGSIFYSADFNTCSSALTDGFTQYSITGAIVWGCTTFGRDPNAPSSNSPFPYGVQMNGFANNTNVPNVDWLISPSLNLVGTTYPLLSFWSRTAFNGQPLQLKISTDYTGGDPSLATWTDLNGKFPAQTSNTWTISENINLAAFKQPNVHIAFVYVSDDDEGARWTLDDLRIDNSPVPPPPSLTVSTTDIQFSFAASGSTADKSFTIIGNDLVNDITLTATGDFSLSKDGSNFFNSITYSVAEANNVSKTVHVRFAPTQNNQNFTGNISISSGSLSASINLTGTSIDPVTTLEVLNWNIEWFGSPVEDPVNDNLQEQNVRTILQSVNADVYALTEIVNEARLASVVSQMPGYAYVLSNYGSHTNTTINPPSALGTAQKLAFVYKTSVLSNVTTTPLLSQGINSAADLSNPAYGYWASGRFPFMMSADVTLNCVTKNVKFILVHAKANTSPTAESYNRRKRGADSLHYTLATNYPNDNIIILGDYNDDLDQSITAGFTTTSWNKFTEDVNNYEPVTLPLSLAGKKSTVSFNDVIDHVIVSNEMESYYMSGSANILSDVTSLVTNYASTTSDHYPVFSRYRFNNTTAPAVTNCTSQVTFCANNTGTYTVPAFVATDDCGDVVSYSYVITGATSRTGNSNDASGVFANGNSVITWTASDGWGNTSICSTTVVVNTNPSVTIPDAFALNSGVLANTVYIGYSPASSLTLNAMASGGAGAYTYSWSNGSTNSSTTVSPLLNTLYTVTVTDGNSCQASASKEVNVIDIRAGKKLKQVNICHNSMSLTVGVDEVPTHLAHGDMLDICSNSFITKETESLHSTLAVKAMPNPSTGQFVLSITTENERPLSVRVTDILGRVVEQKQTLLGNQVLRLTADYKPGIYFAEVMQGTEKVTVKLIRL